MIRLARPEDCVFLPAVEKSAGEPFRAIGMTSVAEAPVPPPSFYPPLIEEGLLWVATDEHDRPIGFCACLIEGDFLYVDELAVVFDRQRQGHGRALMDAAGLRAIALRTFRDVSWNAPYYRKLGYEIADPPDLAILTSKTIAHERASDLDPETRCTMVLWLHRLSGESHLGLANTG
jgi:GNAT superfamily N-acetyltransferase